MDTLNVLFEIYLQNKTAINAGISMVGGLSGISMTDIVKYVQKHSTQKLIMVLAHLVLCALLYHISNNDQSPLEEVIDETNYTKSLIPPGVNLLPGQLLDMILSSFMVKMIIRLLYVAVELYTFITGLVYYIGDTYIPLYFGQITAWILNLIPPLNARNNNWPVYGSVVAVCHIVIAVYIYIYSDEIDEAYYIYNVRDLIAFVFGAIYWAQLAYFGNEIDENDDGNFTIKEIYAWYKHHLFKQVKNESRAKDSPKEK